MKVPKAFKTPPEKTICENCIGKNNSKKNCEKKTCSFYISEDVLNKLNSKIGYTSRSKVLTQLVLEYVNKKDLEKK